MKNYSFQLETYTGRKSRHTCPNCNKREFTRYVDANGNYLADEVGRCNREIECGYHYTPKHFFDEKGTAIEYVPPMPIKRDKPKPYYIPFDMIKQSINGQNNFISFLHKNFEPDIVEGLIDLYFIGTSKAFPGANIFYFIDINYRVRAGKIMNYDSNGHRIKTQNHSVHSILKMADRKPFLCLFGEHLLKGSTKRVAIVEAPKTAIICAGFMPQYDWLAAGALSWLTHERCKNLRGKNVTLFPDNGAHKIWQKKANELIFNCSKILEGAEIKKGADLADYLASNSPYMTAIEPFKPNNINDYSKYGVGYGVDYSHNENIKH